MSHKVITPPASEPVTLSDAKLHLRVDTTDDDSLISAMISAAREQAESETNTAIGSQTREIALDAFPEAFKLEGHPVASVTSIKYLDESGVEQTLNPADYSLDDYNAPGYVTIGFGKQWPSTLAVPNAVKIRYVCGYTTVPESIKTWIKLHVGTMYKQRESFVSGQAMAIPDRYFQRLLDPYRVFQ